MVKLLDLDPKHYTPHPMHQGERSWTETNCFVDLWIELLWAHGYEPLAALPFTVALDLEGDQFTFFKFPFADLERLYEAHVFELNIWDDLLRHTLSELSGGRPVVVELDSFYLPDTAGTAYQQAHVKTSVAVNLLDVVDKRLGYFHNAGYFELQGADFDSVFRLDKSRFDASHLPPYVEVVRKERMRRFDEPELVARSVELLRKHLALMPTNNPFARYQARFADDLEWVRQREMPGFHAYSFATLRQAGANYELCRDYLAWLAARTALQLDRARSLCETLATVPKTIQFKLARAIAGKRAFDPAAQLAEMSAAWSDLRSELTSTLGSL